MHYGSSASAVDAYVHSYSQQTGRILDHIQHIDPAVRLTSVRVNGFEGDRLELTPGPGLLEVEVIGHLERPTRLGLEARVSDRYERGLASYSPGHEAGGVPLYSAGPFVVRESIQLPRLNRGEYLVSLFITNPNIIGWVDLPYALRIVSPGSPTPTGFVFDYDLGAGWTLLSPTLTASDSSRG
jgi:hypothetical protein